MTSPLDTTLHQRSGSTARSPRRLISLCAAGRAVLEPRSVVLAPGTLEIGRAVGPEALGLTTDPHVSRRHAALDVDLEGRVTLRSHGGAPTEVNGVEVEHAELADGDLIGLGESVILLRAMASTVEPPAIEGIVGESPGMRAVRRAIAKVGPAPVTVLILGESGTGKELTARALHEASRSRGGPHDAPRREGPFVALNCAAIPATLAESQLFGHVAGAFTGAQKASPGVFRAADKGTLFLDELADLPIELQPKLLRVLEERAVTAVGSTSATPVDVRVIAATNRDLVAEVQAGRFRGDLYARLAEFTITLPALRDRREDILPILTHQYRDPLPVMRFELIRALLLHPWPFNARELRTIATQLRMASEDDAGPLGLSALGDRLGSTARLAEPVAPRAQAELPSKAAPRPPSKSELASLLSAHRGSVTEVARATGRSRKQVYRWLEAHALDPERYRGG